ncbi:MAG: M2 family metallopeptidase [Candidatus Eisenbacteria bacterium]|nr:M2 family metallopeptidase [Candidatus Eisenbacteria bacterium]
MTGRWISATITAALLLGSAGVLAAADTTAVPRAAVQERADRFLEILNAGYKALYTVEQGALWDAATDVTPEHDAASTAAGKARAAFCGNPVLLRECRELLRHEADLTPLTVRQLRRALLNAAEGPMTNPALVTARIESETQQASTLNGFTFKLGGQPITANDIDGKLRDLTGVPERLAVWEASKMSGPALKPGLVKLQGLRNGVAKELGYTDYFSLQAALHDMTTAEVIRMHEDFLRELKPLYQQLYTWARYELAKKYRQPVPERLPAHWLPNRWSQEWTAFVEVPGLDEAFKSRSPEWMVKTAEAFYVGMGRRPLSPGFWKNSDLYELAATEKRRKNTHASCWNIDLEDDIRSLMNVKADEDWFGTSHHELGHGYYDMAYTRPEVPYLLRTGASPAFHEGFATVAEIAARQTPYRRQLGLLPPGRSGDDITPLLRDALSTVPFMFWDSGVMTHWEADLYAHDLPPDQYNARWWQYVREYQGIDPPSPRGEELCDPATKTHINDTPAYYFSYAMASVFAYQVHDHIARKILKQDPRDCNYAGNKEVGAFLESMQKYGATKDWRSILREATGEDLSTRAMVEYYRPLMTWLEKQNKGRKIGW